MATSHGGGDLIAAIYDAIIEPSGWGGVVTRIVDATKSVSGGLHIQQSDAVHLSALCNTDPFFANAFVQHFVAFSHGKVVADTTITLKSLRPSWSCQDA